MSARDALTLIDARELVREVVTARPEVGRFVGYSPPAAEALAAAEGDVGGPPDLRRTWTWATDQEPPWAPLGTRFETAAHAWTESALDLLTARMVPGLSLLLGADLAAVYGTPRAVCRVNDYPPVTVEPLTGQMRAGAHRDYGPLTLVIPDGPGLQLWHRGAWLDVPYDPDEVVVNVGDELRSLAALAGRDGTVAPALHRVTAPPAGAGRRSSLVCFWFGEPDTVVGQDEDGTGVTSEMFVQRRVLAQVGQLTTAASGASDQAGSEA
jgi:isopenicillin N synthase-like dioxygenase